MSGSNAAALRGGAFARLVRLHRLIVVLRRVEPRERLIALVDDLADAGVRLFEVTFDGPSAGADVAALRERLHGRSDGPHAIGAGTVLGPDLLDAARRAGADFVVAPSLDPALVAAAVGLGLPFVPGAFSPTEILAGWNAGATFVKLFPASAVGPAFVRELRGPMPEIELIPTGGIDGSDAPAFLDAGAAAVGIGTAIVRAGPAARRAIVASLASRPSPGAEAAPTPRPEPGPGR